MANLARWAIDQAYGSTAIAFTATDLNSLASGGGALSTTVVTNGTNLDTLAEVSFVVTVGGTTLATSLLSLYVLPLNQDASTYGDGYASSTTTQPVPVPYLKGAANVKVGVASAATVYGTFNDVPLPAGSFKFALGNNLGVTLYSTASLTLAFRSKNFNLNG